MNAPAPALPESAETAPRGFARRALDGVYAASAVLAGIALFGIFFLMMAQMTVRELGTSIPSADDMAGQLCVAVTFLALAQTFRRGELIRVSLMLAALRPVSRRVAELFSLAVALVSTLYLTWWCLLQVLDSHEFGEVSQGALAIPLWLPQLPMPIGAAFLTIAIAEELVRVARRQTPTYVLAEQDRLARGDFSGEV